MPPLHVYVEQARNQHDEFVFIWRRERVENFDQEPVTPYQPVQSMNNTAWQTARRKAGRAVSTCTTCGTRSACGYERRTFQRTGERTSCGTGGKG